MGDTKKKIDDKLYEDFVALDNIKAYYTEVREKLWATDKPECFESLIYCDEVDDIIIKLDDAMSVMHEVYQRIVKER